EGARQMALIDLGIEILGLAAANGVDEVCEVVGIRAAVELLDDLAVLIEGGSARIARQDEVAVAAVEDHADLGAAEVVGLQAADLEDQLLIAVIMDADLGIGGFAGILVGEAAAVALHRLAQIVDAKTPAGEIHLMDALVAQVAVAGI